MVDQVLTWFDIIYQFWPTYAGAIIVLSGAYALVAAPAQILRVRTALRLHDLLPQQQQILATNADTGAKLKQLRRLRRQHRVRPSLLALPVLLRGAGLVVIYLVARRLGRDAPLVEFGVDLNAIWRPDWRYLVLPLAWSLVAVIGHAAMGRTGAPTRARFVGALLVGALLPAAALLYLVATGAVWAVVALLTPRPRGPGPARLFRDALRLADAQVRAGQPAAATRIRREALARFSADAAGADLVRNGPAIRQILADLAATHPDDAVAALTTLTRRDPACLDQPIERTVLSGWARSARAGQVSAQWATLNGLWGPQDFRNRLNAALAEPGRTQISSALAEHATSALIVVVDRSWRAATLAGRSQPYADVVTWRLLDHLAPATAPRQRADWLCHLGDLAGQRNDVAEADGRYAVAAQLGSDAARHRLAYRLATTGHRLLQEADLAGAKARFAEALAMVDDTDYRLLHICTGLLCDPHPGAHLDQLQQLRDGLTTWVVDFWSGVGRLRSGELDQAARHFAAVAGATAVPPEAAGLVEAATALLAVLHNDTETIAARARNAWRSVAAADYPVAPASVVAALARHHPQSLIEILNWLPDDQRIDEQTAVLVGGLLARAAVDAVAGGALGSALAHIEAAQRALEIVP